MKFQEIDHLAQSVDKLPDIANLGDRYVYHCLREVYDRFHAGKLDKEETEAERKKLYQGAPALPGAGGAAPESL